LVALSLMGSNSRSLRSRGGSSLVGMVTGIVLGTGVSHLWAAQCDLAPLSLPEKNLPVKLGSQMESVRVGVQLSFTPTASIYTITERASARVAKASVAKYVEREVGNLPNDQCGSVAKISKNDVTASSGNLVSTIAVAAEQWGCLIGVRGLIAQGTIEFKTTFRPTISRACFARVESVGFPRVCQ
jgi:hypothetical protein